MKHDFMKSNKSEVVRAKGGRPREGWEEDGGREKMEVDSRW